MTLQNPLPLTLRVRRYVGAMLSLLLLSAPTWATDKPLNDEQIEAMIQEQVEAGRLTPAEAKGKLEELKKIEADKAELQDSGKMTPEQAKTELEKLRSEDSD